MGLAAPCRSPPSLSEGRGAPCPAARCRYATPAGGCGHGGGESSSFPAPALTPSLPPPILLHPSCGSPGEGIGGEKLGTELQSCACPSGWASAAASLRHRGGDARPQRLRDERRLVDGSSRSDRGWMMLLAGKPGLCLRAAPGGAAGKIHLAHTHVLLLAVVDR